MHVLMRLTRAEHGLQIVYDELIKVISERYPDVYYENVDFVFPPYVVVVARCGPTG